MEHPPEHIVAIVRRLGSGRTAKTVCRNVSSSEATL
jgi:hypothetical protein